MEYIEGSRPRGPVPQDDAVRLAGGIAAALEAAHARGIIHRDLKPDNVLLTAAGVKLLDFGLALFDEPIAVGFSDTVAVVSVPGTVIGTAAYMSPEQVQGLPADTRSDIFAFGLLVYELLTGRQPFAGGSAADTMAAILRDDPPPLRTPSGDAPAWLTSIVMRCLHKAPSARFQTMSEVRAALDATSVCVEDPPPAVVVPSIAVLPFANISGDKDNEYLQRRSRGRNPQPARENSRPSGDRADLVVCVPRQGTGHYRYRTGAAGRDDSRRQCAPRR